MTQDMKEVIHTGDPHCRDCEFSDVLKAMDVAEKPLDDPDPNVASLFKSLSFLDRFLAVFILLAMFFGVLIGVYAENQVKNAFGSATLQGVFVPILIGLLVMMWPVLTQVEYERLPTLFSTRRIWAHVGLSIVLNWIIAPFVMLALAWATLPEAALERERKGVILVGVARCIAMVLIWNGLACGDPEYCAILVGVNSILQIILFSPYAVFFLNIMGGTSSPELRLEYGHVAVSVCIYLGIPLVAGVITRFAAKILFSPRVFNRFLHYFGSLALIGLLYTITILFAYQGNRIVHNIGSVFRMFVPLVLYFMIVWTSTFIGMLYISRSRFGPLLGGYDKAVVQSFTAGSNNFELAIGVAVANFGAESPEVLAATIGSLVEVPVLLGLTYVALYLRKRLIWSSKQSTESTDGNRRTSGDTEVPKC